MSEEIKNDKRAMKVGLIGASFETGNLGVSALAESSIKCIYHRWPNAEVVLLGAGRFKDRCIRRVAGTNRCFQKLPIRFCSNVFLSNHFLVLAFYALLLKVLRFERFRKYCCKRNSNVRQILALDLVADITGGDSFSDIYGMKRFTIGFMIKWLLLAFNKPLVLLPQTYGPFKSGLSKLMAGYILKKAKRVYSRDKAGVDLARWMLNSDPDQKVSLSHDVAFVLDPQKPRANHSLLPDQIEKGDKVVVGVNISGLLFNGGYTKTNMFDLKVNYRGFVFSLIEHFMADKSVVVLLVPHVFPPDDMQVESDLDACLSVYNKMSEKYPGRIFTAKTAYDQNEIKYLIGKCSFFVGSRMHSCIAALSQCVPAVGIAYSSKFTGVFDSIDLSHCVADARDSDETGLIEKIEKTFENRHEIKTHLTDRIPKVQAGILSLFFFQG